MATLQDALTTVLALIEQDAYNRGYAARVKEEAPSRTPSMGSLATEDDDAFAIMRAENCRLRTAVIAFARHLWDGSGGTAKTVGNIDTLGAERWALAQCEPSGAFMYIAIEPRQEEES